MRPFLCDVEYLENVDQASAKSYQVNSLMNLSSENFIADKSKKKWIFYFSLKFS